MCQNCIARGSSLDTKGGIWGMNGIPAAARAADDSTVLMMHHDANSFVWI